MESNSIGGIMGNPECRNLNTADFTGDIRFYCVDIAFQPPDSTDIPHQGILKRSRGVDRFAVPGRNDAKGLYVVYMVMGDEYEINIAETESVFG